MARTIDKEAAQQLYEARKKSLKGVGRKKGTKNPATLEKEAIKKALEQRYMRATEKIANSQILIATGQTFLYKIEKEKIIGPKGGVSYRSKSPQLVESQWEIENYLEGLVQEGDMHDDQDPGATYYYITTKEPNNMAIDSIINRVHGKPKESIEHSGEVKFSLRNLYERRKQLEEGKIIEGEIITQENEI